MCLLVGDLSDLSGDGGYGLKVEKRAFCVWVLKGGQLEPPQPTLSAPGLVLGVVDA